MTPRLPVVGVSTYAVYADWGVWRGDSLLTPRTYLDKLAGAGAMPLLLPSHIAGVNAVPQVLSMLDALVLIGGEDMCGVWSGREESAEAHQHHTLERDRFEVALVQGAWEIDLPTLGICRGAQVLNVARGGTLIEDLPSAGASEIHRLVPGTFHRHPVIFNSSATLRGDYDPSAHLPSHHHQAVDKLGTGLIIVGRAEDDVVEAVEAVDRRFVVGVQWHPEEDEDGRIFTALINAARVRRAERTDSVT